MTSYVDKLRLIAVIQHRPLPGGTLEREQRRESQTHGSSSSRQPLTMEPTCHEDKKFQSSWKLFPSSTEPVRKDSPVNPYNRSDLVRICPKWLLPDDADDSESGVVSGLPEFECGVLANSYMDACSCCPQEASDHADRETRARGCCREDWAKKAAYRKIKERVENAVKVIPSSSFSGIN